MFITNHNYFLKIDDMASGRKRIRNNAARPSYADTFLGQTDPSASSSGTASAQEHVPESQSQGKSPKTIPPSMPRPPPAPYVPPAQYEPLPYYPQYEPPPYHPQYEPQYQH